MSEAESALPVQRIDKWLWYARLVKSRSLAQKLVAGGHVRVNRDKVTAAAKPVRAGDVLTVAVAQRIRILKVLAPGERRGPAPEAERLYEDLTPPPPPRDSAGGAGGEPGAPAHRAPGSGRPTKRERRETDRFRNGEG
ncbi:RNA-binding S4 domain-containing protein [Stappia sp. ES.058]|uniref:RNA-binding S4 domain-containing protein n=1 Tax=Stappia sp. ES.058 TaxID=1881061 RepID=UPI00087B4A88|nr:RNA-binding S4 domain-containing protein [Stappia sp. ES.058]SDU38983.1 heat shock protein Hsp15 [Stappia sp. ES.058]